jgi:hypothetical protein
MRIAVAPLAVLGVLAAVAPIPASAQGPATIRGRVYECNSGVALRGITVALRNVENGDVVELRTNASGRFTRVGLAPGRYLIAAVPDLEAVPFPLRPRETIAFASRIARVEPDDVLDLLLGTNLVHVTRPAREPQDDPLASNQPHPICDPPLVPLATTTTVRYIIH